MTKREKEVRQKKPKHLSAISPAEWRHGCLELVKIQQLH
jgi:hypothetical protein